MAIIKLAFPQKASYRLRLPAQQHAPITHKGGQNLKKECLVEASNLFFLKIYITIQTKRR